MQSPYSSSMLPFIYVVDKSVAAKGTDTATKSLEQNSDFKVWRLCAWTDADQATHFLPNNFEVRIEDLSTGRKLSDARVPRAIIAPGSSLQSQIDPILLPANANLLFDFKNLTGSSLRIVFAVVGFKVIQSAA